MQVPSHLGETSQVMKLSNADSPCQLLERGLQLHLPPLQLDKQSCSHHHRRYYHNQQPSLRKWRLNQATKPTSAV